MTADSLTWPPRALVVCLCAEWCRVCGEYRPRFEQLQARFPAVQFLWIDVEDEADLLHPLDVENFPTLLLAVGDEPRFLGPVTPQPEMLEPLMRSQIQDPAATPMRDPAVVALLARIIGKFS
jgi:thioredoxin 1